MKKRQSPIPAITGCLVIQLCVGILYIWSVLRNEFPKSYELTPGSSLPAMVTSYMLLAFVAGNFIGGFINDRTNPKITAIIGVVLFAAGVGATGLLTAASIQMIILTYCVFGGLGSGIAYGACISCIQKWLPHRRGLASGLAVSAFGLSTVVFAPVSRALINMSRDANTGIVNFSIVFFSLAGVFFIFGIAACFFVKLPEEAYIKSLPVLKKNSRVVTSKRDYTLGQAIRTVPFWCLLMYIFFINGTWNLTAPLIATLGEGVEMFAGSGRGLTNEIAVFTVSLTGITNTAGRLIMAAVSDRVGRIPASIFLCILTLLGAILMTFVTGSVYVATVAAIAFGYGGPSAINAAISTDFFGAKYSGTNYGIIMMGLGLSSVFFNYVSKSVLMSDPVPTFIMGGITAICAAACMLVIARYTKRLA